MQLALQDSLFLSLKVYWPIQANFAVQNESLRHFTLYVAFPRSWAGRDSRDYYYRSVALRVSTCRRSPSYL
jgi:hypothetical protein